MITSEELNPIFERIVKKEQTEADIAVLRQLLSSNSQNISQIGKYGVNLGQGQNIQIGDHIYQSVNAESIRQTIQELLQEELRKSPTIANTTQTKSLNELVQEIIKHYIKKIQDLCSAIRLLNRKQNELLQQESIKYLVQEARKHYSEEIQGLYSKIMLLNRKQIDIDRLYVDVYILEKITGYTNADIPNLLQTFDLEKDRLAMGRKKKRLPGFEVATKYNKLMVLGKPGSGKTTFLRHLAIACCKGKFQPEQIPVLIELRSIANFKQFDLEKVIQQELEQIPGFDNNKEKNQALTQIILKGGKFLILLDGLDEVAEQARQDVQSGILAFSKKYHRNRLIITCRIQVTESNLENFEYVEIADFNREQVEQFAESWFKALAETSKKGTTLAKNFITKLQQPENQQTAELTVTPVLLSLACWVFQDLQDFPQERTDLYRRGVELLLEQWDEKRGIKRKFSSDIYQKLSVDDKQKLLGHIAVSKFKLKDQFVLFQEEEIKTYVADYLKISSQQSKEVIKSIEAQHGLLIERAYQIYSFSHLTFQEYFAARWLCEPSHFTSTASDIKGQRWQEVLSMVFTTSNADRFARTIKAEIDHLLIDPELQKYLIWLSEKAESIKVSYSPDSVNFSYSPASVRAFYLAFDRAYEPILARMLNSSIERIINDQDRHLDNALNLAFDRAGNLVSDYDSERAYDLSLNLDYALNNALRLANNTDLEGKLKQLRSELPKLSRDSNREYEPFKKWWAEKGSRWTKQLREIMNVDRKIRYNWQFTDVQKQQIKQYHDANQLLMDCLKDSKVSLEVKREIEETLLLPIAEIEKRKREK